MRAVQLLRSGDDQRVLVWRAADVVRGPKKLQPFCMNTRHRSNIFTLDFSCDNSYIFSGGEDSELIKHDFRTHQCVSTYDHLEAVYCVAAHPSSPEVVFTASEDGCVYIIDTRVSRRELGQDMLLCEAIDSFQCVAINPVEPVLVAVSNSHKGSALYDTRNRKKIISYKNADTSLSHENGVSVSFSKSGSQIFSMYRRHHPTIHSLWDANPLCYFSDDKGTYRNSVTMKSGCFMGQDDEFVVSGSDDFRLYIWKVPSATEIAAAKEASASASAPSALSRCGLQQNSPHLVIPGHRSIVNQTRYSNVHRVLVSSGVEKLIKVWSDMPLNAHHSLQRSQDPPTRRKFTETEIHSIIVGTSSPVEPTDPSDEDIKVLALFDRLVEEDMENENDGMDSDISESSELFFPFWDDLQFFYNGDSDSTHSDLYANPSSIEPPWSDDEDNSDSDIIMDELYHDTDSDWDCSCDEEEDEEEEEELDEEQEAEDHERGGRNGFLERILHNVDEQLLGLRSGTTASPSVASGENNRVHEDRKRRIKRRSRRSGSGSHEVETGASPTVNDGGGTEDRSSVAMSTRHRKDGSTVCSVLGASGGPGDDSSSSAAAPIEDDAVGDGYPRTRSKRKKLLDLRARCSTGGGSGSSYVAEDFLRVKPPSNFYASSSSASNAGNQQL